jgi:hypothetical protein
MDPGRLRGQHETSTRARPRGRGECVRCYCISQALKAAESNGMMKGKREVAEKLQQRQTAFDHSGRCCGTRARRGCCRCSRTVETGCLLAQFEWLYQTVLLHPAAFRDAFLVVLHRDPDRPVYCFDPQGQVLVPRVASSAQHEVCSSREHRSPFGLLWSVGRSSRLCRKSL